MLPDNNFGWFFDKIWLIFFISERFRTKTMPFSLCSIYVLLIICYEVLWKMKLKNDIGFLVLFFCSDQIIDFLTQKLYFCNILYIFCIFFFVKLRKKSASFENTNKIKTNRKQFNDFLMTVASSKVLFANDNYQFCVWYNFVNFWTGY